MRMSAEYKQLSASSVLIRVLKLWLLKSPESLSYRVVLSGKCGMIVKIVTARYHYFVQAVEIILGRVFTRYGV